MNHGIRKQSVQATSRHSVSRAEDTECLDAEGFVLLFASLVASVMLTVGIGIGTIVLKELRLSAIGSESQVAFFAADSGVECARYWNDKAAFDKNTSFTQSMSCAEMPIVGDTDNPVTSGSDSMVLGGSNISRFGMVYDSEGSCVDVTVEKRPSGSTIIVARGYNTCADDTRRVERTIRTRIAPPTP